MAEKLSKWRKKEAITPIVLIYYSHDQQMESAPSLLGVLGLGSVIEH